MKQKKLFFFCLAGKKSGYGHISRCVKIADSLKKDVYIKFIVHTQESNEIIDSFLPEFPYLIVWDENEFLDSLTNNIPDVLVVDHLTYDMTYLNPSEYKIVTLDNYHVGADIYINIRKNPKFNPVNEYNGYQYWAIEEVNAKKNVDSIPGIQKLLITCGYSDPGRYTEKILSRVIDFYNSHNDIPMPLVSCILTDVFSADIEDVIKKIYPDVIIKKNLKTIRQEIIDSDLCITTGGNTLIEAVSLCVPTFLIPYGVENSELGDLLKKDGFVEKTDIDWQLNSEFHNKFKSLNEMMNLQSLYNRCKMFDGFGIGRIKKIIMKSLN